MKDQKKAISGRLGGLKGGKKRASILTKEQRSQIAKKAALARWSRKIRSTIMLQWSKKLSSSDAQETVPVGSKMPFLRFTKENNTFDHFTYFREQFFKDLDWVPHDNGELAEISINVTILGESLGLRKMKVDHKPSRALNHSAPTTHLIYDNATRHKLESLNVTGKTVVVKNDLGSYSLDVV